MARKGTHVRDVSLAEVPASDRDEILSMEAEYGVPCLVLTSGGLYGSEAQRYMLGFRKQHGELPAWDRVWVGAET